MGKDQDETPIFAFDRGRGIVWVCDIANSTALLNEDRSVAAAEDFLPRFHWLARAAVDSAGGQFIKWNGDGFLAWFPLELYRDIGRRSSDLMEAIWHMTVLVNVTKLGIQTDRRLCLRHGVTLEHDALITRIRDVGSTSIDLLGRGVVLAYRLAGITSKFPGVVTQTEIAKALRFSGCTLAQLEELKLSPNDELRYFKGEDWGTSELWASVDRQPSRGSIPALVEKARAAIGRAECADGSVVNARISSLVSKLSGGPVWAVEALGTYTQYVERDLLGPLKQVVGLLEDLPKGEPEPLERF